MEDAELVASAIDQSPEAFAAIYDRYVDRIFDYARSVLRSDADAADVTQDTFLAASQRLDQLRDPTRLRPWLYAIARSHAFRTIRERQRTEVSSDIDGVADMTAPDGGIDAQELVWAAAAGLAASDRDILDLHLRQGLDGNDLADALGVSANAANVALHRVRMRLEQSVGAVLLAKSSNNECAELDALMVDGLTPLARKRITRHLDTCDICAERRRAMVSPSAMFAATPFALAPLALRDRVLGSVGGDSAVAASDKLGWRSDGFPDPETIGAGLGAAEPLAAVVGHQALTGDTRPITTDAARPGGDTDGERIATGTVQPDADPSAPDQERTRRSAIAIGSAAAVILVVGLFFMLRSNRDEPGSLAGEPIATSGPTVGQQVPGDSPASTSTTTISPPGTAPAAVPSSSVARLTDAPQAPTTTDPSAVNLVAASTIVIGRSGAPTTATTMVPAAASVATTIVATPAATTGPTTTVPTAPTVPPLTSTIPVTTPAPTTPAPTTTTSTSTTTTTSTSTTTTTTTTTVLAAPLMAINSFSAVFTCNGGTTNFDLSWAVSGDPAGQVNVYRNRSGGSFTQIGFDVPFGGGLSDVPPVNGSYQYWLIATNSDLVDATTTRDVGTITTDCVD